MEHRYTDGERELIGFLAHPGGREKRPGILVLHEAPGLAEHPKMRAGMLKDLGFVALAADMYGDGRTFMGPDAMSAMTAVREDVDLLRRRATAGLQALRSLEGVDADRLVAIGFCFGGMCALELARSGASLRAAVSFHGLLRTARPAEPGVVHASILALNGHEDPLVPAEDVAAFQSEMTAAKADWQLVDFGGARHAFTNRNAGLAGNSALEYRASADRRSWAFMRAFIADALDGVGGA